MTSQVKILIVDDTAQLVDILSKMLREIVPAARILTANNGEEGLLTALQHQPNLIITDLEMEGMDGYEMIRILRHEKNGSQSRIIGMTGGNSSVVKSSKFKMLCNEFLPKPFSLNEIREKVSVELGLENAQGPIQPSANFIKDVLRPPT